MALPLKIFISSTQTDRRWAEWIAWQVEAAGREARIQAWDIAVGGNFVDTMDEAAKWADAAKPSRISATTSGTGSSTRKRSRAESAGSGLSTPTGRITSCWLRSLCGRVPTVTEIPTANLGLIDRRGTASESCQALAIA